MLITGYIPQIRAIKAKTNHLFSSLDEDELQSVPNKGGWSIQQCFQHLTKAGNLYANQVQYVLDEASDLDEQGTCNKRFLQRLFIRIMEPPYRFHLKAPKKFKPKAQNGRSFESPAETIEAFQDLQSHFIGQIKELHQGNKADAMSHSPLTKSLSLSMCELFGVVCAHERRHIWQAEIILQKRRAEEAITYMGK